MRPALTKPQPKLYYNVKTGQYLQYNPSTRQYQPCNPSYLANQQGSHQPQRPPFNALQQSQINQQHVQQYPQGAQQLYRPQQPVQPSSQHVQQFPQVAQQIYRLQQPVQPSSQPVQQSYKPQRPVQPPARPVQPPARPVQPPARPVQPPAQPVQPSPQPVQQLPHRAGQSRRPQQQSSRPAQQLQKPPQTFQRFQLPQNNPPKSYENDQKRSSHVVRRESSGSARVQQQKRPSVPQNQYVSSSQPLKEHNLHQRHGAREQQQTQHLKNELHPKPSPGTSDQPKQKILNADRGESRRSRPTSKHEPKAHSSRADSATLSTNLRDKSASANSSAPQASHSILNDLKSAAPTSYVEQETNENESKSASDSLTNETKPSETSVETSNELQAENDVQITKIAVENDEKPAYVSCLSSLHIGSLCIASGPAHLNKGPQNLSKGASFGTLSGSCALSGTKKLSMGPAQLAKGPCVVTAGPNHQCSGPAGFSKGPAGLASGSHGMLRSSSSSIIVGPTVIPTGPSPATDLVGKTLAVGSANIAKGPSCAVRGPIKSMASACNAELVRG